MLQIGQHLMRVSRWQANQSRDTCTAPILSLAFSLHYMIVVCIVVKMQMIIPQSHRVATYGDFKSPTVAASRSVVATQSPSCSHIETQIAADRYVFAFYSKCESFDCTVDSTASILRLYSDLRSLISTAFAVRSLIVAVSSFCGCSTNHIVSVQSQYTRATADRVQTEYSSSATMDDRTATTVQAVRAQTDSRPIILRLKSPQEILNSSKFLYDQCDRP